MALRRIILRDFVLVQSLDLALQDGFNVLTGETGAGKSILLEALQLAMGARAETQVVREGASKADISAVFDTTESVRAMLDELGVEPGEEGELLLRRTIDAQGKSRGWINGTPVTATQLKPAGDSIYAGAVQKILPHRHWGHKQKSAGDTTWRGNE